MQGWYNTVIEKLAYYERNRTIWCYLRVRVTFSPASPLLPVKPGAPSAPRIPVSPLSPFKPCPPYYYNNSEEKKSIFFQFISFLHEWFYCVFVVNTYCLGASNVLIYVCIMNLKLSSEGKWWLFFKSVARRNTLTTLHCSMYKITYRLTLL